MTKKLLWGLLVILLITSSLLVACTKTTATATSTGPAQTTASKPPAPTTSAPAPTTSSSVQTTTPPVQSTPGQPTAPPAKANWWDKFGAPAYGGAYSLRLASLPTNFDNASFMGGSWQLWFETLFAPDWALDRGTWSFQGLFIPDKFARGLLAESWEQPDAQTIIVHLRHGVKWQNKAPVNGREFTSDDIIQHYDRIRGTGSGYITPNPAYGSFTVNWDKITAKDKYTVVFTFKKPSGTNFASILNRFALNTFEAPESVKAEGGALKDWKKALGTGPWMLTDYIEANSMTLGKNPDYWGFDEHYPKNRLPYADSVKLLVIPDSTTAIAALRTGKLDFLSMVSWQNAAVLAKDMPELQQTQIPFMGYTLTLRVDKVPFKDIRVRRALQMAIDLKSVAQNYYGGKVDGTPANLISPVFKGYAFAYADWPQTLKDDYTFNPSAAKKLLAEAGFPNGFKTNVVTSSIADLQLLQVFKANLLDIGVDMDINAMDQTTFGSFTNAGKHDQMVYTQATASVFDIDRSLQTFYSKFLQNLAHVSDSKYDALYENFTASTADEAAKLSAEADRVSLEQHWTINTFSTAYYAIWQPRLKGYSGEFLTDAGSWGQAFYFARFWVQ
jgi:peptide/nickel transport system substrate-binding protein